MTRVLVFGATGEIGGRIARLCVDAGYETMGVTRGQNTRSTVRLAGVKMLTGDKNDEAFIRDTIAPLNIDVVVDSIATLDNVKSYRQQLERPNHFLFCSSTGTFVPLQYVPADETHRWREQTPVNFWGQCVRDAYILDAWQEDGFPATVLRPTNIIGEHRIPLELWGGRNIEFFRKLKAGEPVTIPACEGVLVQSGYNWDLAGAFVKAIEHAEAARGELFIISCKRAITLGRYLQTAMKFLGSTSDILHAERAALLKLYPDIHPNGLTFLMEHMCLDISKAERLIGYAPSFTTEEGLIKSLTWCETAGLL